MRSRLKTGGFACILDRVRYHLVGNKLGTLSNCWPSPPALVVVADIDQGAPGASIPSSEAANGAEPADAAKRGRNLQKKLRQIQQLKERQAQGSLDAEQQQKLAGEQAIIDELRSLGLQP